ncbi:putative ABC transport system permease protein [Streptomyces sp. Ag109_O5-1]|uniref:FtsX-like permease family protein n=1 Tax=Streptomyces sp. Ag109_O5-1 TaxID=1938851 RepID=UPI000F4E1327|nr:ABC transporter permease [Streptomyces sp. Ag109_O5-1]RPE40136.1 putative ABC transport system permease protein [Streptomyces sp. Ag109_O5-1]
MMLRYALKTVRARKAGFLGAFLALLCAAALISACGTLLDTGLRGTIRTERYAATPVVVSADQYVRRTTVKHKHGKTKVKRKAKPIAERAWLPADLETGLARTPGVARVVPELTFLAQPLTPAGTGGRTAYGHAWESAALTPYRLVSGTAPKAATDLVVDRDLAARAHLRPGATLTVQSTQAPRAYRITGIAAPATDVRHQTSLFFSAAEARRLAAHPGQVTAFGVLPAHGTAPDRLKQAVTRALRGTTAQVSTGDARGPVEFLDAAAARVRLVSMGGAMGGTSLLVAILVVVGTFALTVQQRHRELALLRAIAATPGQIRRLLGREALIVGAVAGTAGALLGLPLGAWLHTRFVALGAVPATLQHTTGVFPPFAAFAATLAGAWAAARIASRRITRIRPTEALAESRVEPARPAWGRIAAGLLLLAGGVVLVVLLTSLRTEPASTPVTFLAVVVLATSVALLGPLLVRAAALLLAGPLRLTGHGGRLATANLRGNAARMASVVTPLTLLIGMTCTVLFVQSTLGDAARAQARVGVTADWVVAAQGPGVPAAAARQLRTRHDAVTEVVRTTVRIGLDKYAAQGVTPEGLTRTWDPEVTAGSLGRLTDRTVAVSRLTADQHHLAPGSTLRLTLGDGTPATLTVAAVYARGLGFGDLTFAHDLVAHHVDNPLASSVLVSTARTQAQLATTLREFPGLRILSPAAADSLQADRQQTNAEVNYLAMGLVLAFTAIAVVNTLAMSVAARIREFALLRLAGATRRQVLRMLRTEVLSVLTLATALGSGIALAVLTAFSVGMTGRAAPTVTPLLYVTVVATATLLALVAAALPGRVALRVPAVTVATAKD